MSDVEDDDVEDENVTDPLYGDENVELDQEPEADD